MKGYIALISIIIISALIILIAGSTSLISIGESNISLQESQSWETFYLANACAEHALLALKDNLNYQGNEVLTFENGTCTILQIEGEGNQDRIIKVTGNAFGQIRRVKIEIRQVHPEMQINSWSEVDSF